MSRTVDREDIFEAWAPRGALWTPWAKPVLFAHLGAATIEEPVLPRPTWVRGELLEVPAHVGGYRTSAQPAKPAIVVDLAGNEGIATGLALADLGFRPVPLYTALPSPASIVPMEQIALAIVAAAQELARKELPADAPPAFLLDARRSGEGRIASPGQFDNRSVAVSSDFPSGDKLRAAGIGAVVLVCRGEFDPASDLTPALASWQAQGLAVLLVRADAPGAARPIHVRPPGVFARVALWWTRSQLRRGPGGAFGAWTPEARHGG
jgi:hypothetical protein